MNPAARRTWCSDVLRGHGVAILEAQQILQHLTLRHRQMTDFRSQRFLGGSEAEVQ
jgi:hypothetical protein